MLYVFKDSLRNAISRKLVVQELEKTLDGHFYKQNIQNKALIEPEKIKLPKYGLTFKVLLDFIISIL